MEVKVLRIVDDKKVYVAPAIEVVEIEFESLMSTASGETGSAGVGDGPADGPDLVNKRRGSWGNLWE